MSDGKKSLYERLGGYDAIVAMANDLLPRLNNDPHLGRFWAHRGVEREKQLLIDFLCASAGGPVYYRGRDMALTHRRHAYQRDRLERVSQSRGRDLGKASGAGC